MKFTDVIGNSEAINRLRLMVDHDHLPHAILLAGPKGVAKLALARALAQYIHCQNHVNGDSCGTCPACLQHQSHNHADCFYSYPILKKQSGKVANSATYSEEWKTFLESGTVENYEYWLSLIKNENGQPMIYVDESDLIIHNMSRASYSAKHKIQIIWLPEKMKQECANALLKIIEEPYRDTIFILVSDNAAEILPTISSRLQMVELKKPSTEMIAHYLQQKYNVDWQDAVAIAAPADGDILMAEQQMSLNSETRQFHEQFVSLMRLAYQVNLPELKEWSEKVADYKREKARRFLQYAARQVRENYIFNLRTPQLNYLTKEEAAFSTRFAPFINELNVEGLIEELNRAETDIQGNANAKIVLFDMAIKTTIWIKKKPQ